ncbi:MAG: hypothetical protein ACOYL6_04830 [Bacteriovoracaceae bacterium]
MFKTGLTQVSFSNFLTAYQSFHSSHDSLSKAYVYVDASGVKLLTDADLHDGFESGIFALATTGDGLIEALSIER